jgi:hypothetical protein
MATKMQNKANMYFEKNRRFRLHERAGEDLAIRPSDQHLRHFRSNRPFRRNGIHPDSSGSDAVIIAKCAFVAEKSNISPRAQMVQSISGLNAEWQD